MIMSRTFVPGALSALAAVAWLSTTATPAAAQSQGLGETGRLQALIDELKSQLDRGERERLIDPWYLRDLRGIIGRYDWPWAKLVFSDDFSGKGPQPEPPWKVTAGEFLIDWRYGLRSVVKPAVAQAETAPPAKQPAKREAVQQLFGQILQQAIKGKEDKPASEQPAPETAQPAPAPSFAAAMAPVPIGSAFALRVELTSRPAEGVARQRFEFGPYQGEAASAGYRLAYAPAAAAGAPSLELLALSARGTASTVEIYDQPLALQDGQPHVVEWTRDAAGAMVVTVDGARVMAVSDRSFRDPFDGFALVNGGGDYALRSLTIHATN